MIKRNAHAPKTRANTRSTISATHKTVRRTAKTIEGTTMIAPERIDKIETKMPLSIVITREAGTIGEILTGIAPEIDIMKEMAETEGHAIVEITAETMTKNTAVEDNSRSQSKTKTLTTSDAAR